MRDHRQPWRRSAVALAALVSLTAAPWPAAGTTPAGQSDTLIALARRASTINMDVLQAMHAYVTTANVNSPSIGCLDVLVDASGELAAELGELSDLAVLSSSMKEVSDVRAVARVIHHRIASTVRIIELLRPETSAQMGSCGDTALVQSKGQVLLDFMQATTDQLKEIGLDRQR